MLKSPDSLAEATVRFMSQSHYRPMKDHELARALNVHHGNRSNFRQLLRQLEQSGRIKLLRKNRWSLPDARREITGRLSVSVQGYGFVIPDQAGHPDIAIDKDAVGSAMHGDLVAVEVTGRVRRAAQEDRIRGRITRVIERKTRTLAGLLLRNRSGWHVVPDNPRYPFDVRIRDFTAGAKAIEREQVAITLDEVMDVNQRVTGVVTENLGAPGEPGVDMLTILRNHDLRQEFEDDVLAEARTRSPDLSKADLEGRRDLRQILTMTIDPEDAKDFDDAVSLEKRDGGEWRLGVHIADVAHFVKMNTDVDREARRRGNSVYMVDRFIPMLPQYLTSDVCSLRPNVDRLAHSVILAIDGQGHVISHETARSVIHSSVRLNYDQVQAFMDGNESRDIPAKIKASLRDMIHLAGLLRKNRMRAGALDLSMPEVKCVLDEKGDVLDIHKRGAPEAYHLIEECMLLANVAVAEILSGKEVPALYRIHEAPSDEQWAKMADDLMALDIHATPSDRRDLQEVTRSIAGTPVEYSGNLAVLRNLKRALYSASLKEHFGLAFEKYTHFTSPIRRYPDLIVHRILGAIEQRRPPPYSFNEIEQLAGHCSVTEREADEAEEESLSVKRIAFYSDKLSRGDIGPFQAVITSIVSRGLIVEISETLQRGLVSFSMMKDDHYVWDQARGRAVGQRKRKIWKLGQPVDVELVGVDKYRRLVDFRLRESEPAAPRRDRKKRHRRR